MKYNKPTQVLFKDSEDFECYGIAYKDEIICACCGSIFEIEDVNIIRDLEWIDFGKNIGEE